MVPSVAAPVEYSSFEAPLPPPPKRRPSLRGFSLRPSEQTGERIGEHYHVEGFLGQGGTADVFLARDERTREYVVVKRLKESIAENPELRRRFLLEAKALESIHHPAVIRVLEVVDPPEGAPWLTLEALRGESLGDFLKRSESMDPELGLRLVRETAHALEAVHAVGVVHRDIKPDNLFLVGPFGEPDHVKVLDFGMAHLPDEEHDANSTSILGTVQYMAPEQILVEPVDARTDVYALGVVLFRLVTGHLPFDAKSSGDLIRHQLFSPIPPPSWLADDLPDGLEDVILRATRKSPKRRYQSMHEFGQALDAIVGLVSRPVNEADFSDVRASLDPNGSDPNAADPSDSDPSAVDRSYVGELAGPREVDVYEPVSDRGRDALRVLAKEFGRYASIAPSRDGTG